MADAKPAEAKAGDNIAVAGTYQLDDTDHDCAEGHDLCHRRHA